MLKKLIRITVTLGLLLAGYFGYVRGFAVLAGLVGRPLGVPVLPGNPLPSPSAQLAKELAVTAFGPGHWTINAPVKYYDTSRGYWIYAGDFARKDDGKRLEFEPFALIWRTRGGRPLKTLSGQKAAVVFNQPPDLVRGGGEAHVVHARIDGDVRLRDDKGTPGDLGDDLTIGPLTYLDFNERNNQIRSDESLVEVRDRDMLATGEGVVIDLRPKPSPGTSSASPGYDGAQTIRLLQKVHITVQDVGRTGIVPGGAATLEAPGEPREPRPGEITCDGELRIDLPAPQAIPAVGPPAPPGPTFAHFSRNVRVRQGDAQKPEQLDCDQLHLTLMPAEPVAIALPPQGPATPLLAEADPADVASPSGVPAPAPTPALEGPLTNLTLSRAKATGHAVWLQSVAQGVYGYGNELRYERHAPKGPDRTYFRGDKYTEVKKVNASSGTVDVIRTIDLTIFHNGPDHAPATVVAGGPGAMETRNSKDQKIERSASWRDRLVMQPVENDPTRRQITLDGQPRVNDPAQGSISASDSIVAMLVSKKTPGATAPTASTAETSAKGQESSLSGGAYRMEMMRAWGQVEMVSNGPAPVETESQGQDGASLVSNSKRIIKAREWLGVVFEEPATPAPAPSSSPAVAANPEPPKPAEKPADAKTSNDLPLNVEADRIWAWMVQQGTEEAKGEVREVRLRGNVLVHQDPVPGKPRGIDVEGENVDLISQVGKLFEIRAYGAPGKAAFAATDAFSIEGMAIGLDQAKSYASVHGPGRLIQENVGGDILGDAKPASQDKAEPTQDKKTADRGPLTITWGLDPLGKPLLDADGKPVETWMKFYGQPLDENGQPEPARAYFYNGVRAWTRDSSLACGQMEAILDQPVDFQRTRREPKPEDGAEPSRPQIVRVECERDVKVVSRKLDDHQILQEKQRVEGEKVTFDKLNNTIQVDSAGQVFLYTRKKPKDQGKEKTDAPIAESGRTQVRPVNDTRRGARAQPTVIAGRSTKRETEGDSVPPLELTRIWFDKQMVGQVRAQREDAKRQPGQAEFFGNVRVIHAQVPDENTELDPDAPPKDFVYTVSRSLRVISEPPPPGSKEADRILVEAWKDLYALTGRQGRQTAIRSDDHMTYDSNTGVSYIYGDANGVQIADQSGPGQTASFGQGRVVVFNHKTSESRIIDARSIQLVDPRGGARATVPKEPKKTEDDKTKKTRKPFPRIPSSNKERRNFTGK